MIKKSIVLLLFFVLVLSGCGLLGPDVDDPRLTGAFEEAREALHEAEDEGAADYASEEFEAAKEELETARTQHQESPSLEVVDKYHQARVKAHRATIKSLLAQVKERENREEELLADLEETEEQLENQKAKIERLETEATQRTEDYEQARGELAELEESYTEQQQELARIRGEKEELEAEVDRYRGIVDNLEAELTEVQQQIGTLQVRLDEKTDELEQLQAENEAIAAEFEEKLEDARVRIEDHGVVVNLDSKILFDIAEARLKDEAKELLQEAALVLNDYPDREVRVEGHTCDLPIREAFPSNWELSSARAIEVLKFLVYGHGVEAGRIAAVAFGETRPLKPNDSEENRKMNRRVEITLLPPELPAETRELLD